MNHDALPAGTYPARLQVVGPQLTHRLDLTIQIEIPKSDNREVPFSRSVFSQDIVVTGPPGRYRFLATFERGAAAGGGEAEFYVGDTAGMPDVATEVVLLGDDRKLASWLKNRNIVFREALTPTQTSRELIIASGRQSTSEAPQAFLELAQRIARGSAVVFLTPETLLEEPFTGQPAPLRWAPLSSKVLPQLAHTPDAYFRADPWSKKHPVFEGLPSGGILDYKVARALSGSICSTDARQVRLLRAVLEKS